MPQVASALSASSKVCLEARYQNECWYSIPWSNNFCALALHEVSNLTLPSCFALVCANAGGASVMATAIAPIAANNVLSMVLSSAANPADAHQTAPRRRLAGHANVFVRPAHARRGPVQCLHTAFS